MVRWVIESTMKFKGKDGKEHECVNYFVERSMFNIFSGLESAKKYTSPMMAKLDIQKFRLSNCKVVKKVF